MNAIFTPLCRSALHERTRQLGASFAQERGWLVPDSFAGVEAEVAAARAGAVLADESANARILVQGEEAEGAVRAVFAVGDLPVGAGAQGEKGRIYRLRRDVFFAGAGPGEGEALVEALEQSCGERFVTITDITHGRAEIRLVGPASRALLSKICGLDFAEGTFAEGMARQSSVAKTAQLVLRRDLGSLVAFSLVGGRSLGEYLWDTLVEAGGEWGIVPVGRQALRALGAGG